MQHAPTADIFIGAAAVADYRPQARQANKIKKSAEDTSLTLCKTPDILAAVASLPAPPFTVGFAAETDNLEQYALDKLQRKKLHMIAANWVGRATGGFESEQNALQVYWATGQQHLPMMAKRPLAEHLLHLIATRYTEEQHANRTT
jgi:phosphopantothenoylcysteine decarboxylase/phosphopantothenate--cysteine ligase